MKCLRPSLKQVLSYCRVHCANSSSILDAALPILDTTTSLVHVHHIVGHLEYLTEPTLHMTIGVVLFEILLAVRRRAIWKKDARLR